MKKLLAFITVFLFFISTLAFASGGHYKNGKGSSHKGGSYKNSATNNHYKKRK